MSQTVTTRNISTAAALQAAEAALEHAGTLGIAISVAVVDRGGNTLGLLRANEAPFHTAAIATDKAYTAASFGAPTDKLGEALHGHGPAVFHGLLERPRMAAFGGGLPIELEGERGGGIGVSGGDGRRGRGMRRGRPCGYIGA